MKNERGTSLRYAFIHSFSSVNHIVFVIVGVRMIMTLLLHIRITPPPPKTHISIIIIIIIIVMPSHPHHTHSTTNADGRGGGAAATSFFRGRKEVHNAANLQLLSFIVLVHCSLHSLIRKRHRSFGTTLFGGGGNVE